MSLLDKEPVKRAENSLKEFDPNLNVITLNSSARTAREAASSLGCEVGAIVKSLLFKTDNTFTLNLIAGDRKASLNKIKKILQKRDVSMASAEDVKNIISGGPVPRHIKPIWPFIAFTAFQTLPKEFKDIYGIKTSKFKNSIVSINLGILKYTRPFLPPFFRLIAPARWAKQRINRKPDLSFKEKSKFM